MKSIELMIGDRVQANGNPVQVKEIINEGGINGEWDGAELYGIEYSFEEIAPIPLTAEILEKNGFIYDIDRRAYTMGLVFQLKVDRVGYYDLYISGLPRPICHVHTLQHALRLCGVEKEVVL